MVIAIDGPAGAGKSTVARGARGARSASPTSTPGRCTGRVALAAIARRRRPRRRPARWGGLAAALEIALSGAAVLLDGEDVSEQIRVAGRVPRPSRVSVHPEVRAAMVERQRELVAEGD